MFHDCQDGYENGDYVPQDLLLTGPASDLAETVVEDTTNGKNQEADEGNHDNKDSTKKDMFGSETPPEMPCLALVVYEPKPSDTSLVEIESKDEAPHGTMVERQTMEITMKDQLPTKTKTGQEPSSALGAKPKALPKPQQSREPNERKIKDANKSKGTTRTNKVKNVTMSKKDANKFKEKQRTNQVKNVRTTKNDPKKIVKDDVAKKLHSVAWL